MTNPLILAFVAAARALGADVNDAHALLLPSGAVHLHIRTAGAEAAGLLASALGATTAEWIGDGRSEWFAAEVGECGDPYVVSITGGHRPVCQCHPRIGRAA